MEDNYQFECDCGGMIRRIWDNEEEVVEIEGILTKTGRTRFVVLYRECADCGKRYEEDFKEDWYYQ